MVELIQPPDPRTLLPPLLACLPAAFVSTRPPPALLPLLSPILRQRVHILSSVASSPSDCWIRLLCWGDEKADRVQSIIDGATFELHPASGEIEVPNDLAVTYKRVDEETLHSRIVLPEYHLSVIYVWCPNDQDGAGPGWRVAELLPREGPSDDDATWSTSIGEANERAKERWLEDALKDAEQHESRASRVDDSGYDNDEEDAYWAQYDNTPGRTPSIKTPAPRTFASTQPPLLSEESYFAQYADVQPAMDNDDPSEDRAEVGESSLNGNIFANLIQQHIRSREAKESAPANGHPAGQAPNDAVATMLSHPRPASTSSGGSDAVARLEQEAESQSASEMAVKQHIGTSIKSLFRLARSTGMAREEFQSLVRTELELLSLADDE
ncbi:hypothetical protein VTN77DRAFT_7789 [Rasamsonia byssochlamydoides]|uniref:uncharacterized protein n=1 Tax=Rasamsonia byssochlamydoides TaxID=89139 RepID=UPI003742A56B